MICNQTEAAEVTPMFDFKSLPVIPAGLVAYNHQVGGHGTRSTSSSSSNHLKILRHPSKDIIFKPLQNGPRSVREANFYLEVFSKDASPSAVSLRPFLSTFYGVFKCNTSASLIYIALEDVLAGLRHPSVCDLKMGRSACPPDVEEAKLRRENAKYPHRDEVGFLFTGMKLYDIQKAAFLTVPRLYGRSLDFEHVYSHAIRPFLGSDTSQHAHLASQFVARLKDLRTWMVPDRSGPPPPFAFYCSSFLLAYDDDESASTALKLVDFAHFRHLTEPSSFDTSGFVHGIDVLITMLERAIGDTTTPLPINLPFFLPHQAGSTKIVSSKTPALLVI